MTLNKMNENRRMESDLFLLVRAGYWFRIQFVRILKDFSFFFNLLNRVENVFFFKAVKSELKKLIVFLDIFLQPNVKQQNSKFYDLMKQTKTFYPVTKKNKKKK